RTLQVRGTRDGFFWCAFGSTVSIP
ncbi:hypothetical protein A2U01_0111815, partial [Trifolium medium]|nr:hypothetical protein [Trifolium medium]